jgi:3-hydroxybutyryl-CoA dehydrogenase
MQDGKFRPSRIQKQLVDAGYWGKKTGKGFYEY